MTHARTMLAAGLCLLLLALPWLGAAQAAERYITVASTTSTQNSGLFDHILPIFTEKTGIDVRVVAVGTGAAIRLARSGDADVLLVHHQISEEEFVAEGFGVERHPLMYNDFVIVGPAADPAGIKGGHDAVAALKSLAGQRATFLSRGDDSGTNKRELELWRHTGVDPKGHSGTWYRETGAGMGATLNTASAIDGYTLTDRGTWLAFQNKRNLTLLVEGDPGLRNDYGVILVSPARFPHVKSELGQAFIDWLTSDEGRAAIVGHKVGGEQLFFPPAIRRGS